jgi:hypothetical protein
MAVDLGFASVRDQSMPAKGGDIIFSSGKGYVPPMSPNAPEHGDIRFVIAGGQEMMRLCGDGKVIVRGEQVDDNRAAYDAFMAWIADTFGWNRDVGGK